MEIRTNATAIDLERAHVSLTEDLRTLELALLAQPEASIPNVHKQLVLTHGHVSDHFRFEEQNGWMEAVRRQEPRFEHSIQRLIDEHRELIKLVDMLIEELEAKMSVDAAFRQKVLHWIQRVREHEARENGLLEDAFVEDLGAGD